MKLTLLVLIFLTAACPFSYSETVSVAVASNFTAPMTSIAQQFESKTGHRAQLSFGSSGKIFAQIANGAPFEVFLSADQTKPIALEDRGLAVPGSRFTYALGTLALWSANPDYTDRLIPALKQGDYNTLAIANPKLAPYGMAAMETLNQLGIEENRIPRLAQGENIAQAYQFISSGNADLGFVALSQIMESGKMRGVGWIVPPHLYSPIRQDVVLLTKGKDNSAAHALLNYLRSSEAQSVLKSYGYGLDTEE